MKKKQFLALIMAGSLAAGMSPVTMAFAEADTQTVTIDDAAAVAVESEEGVAAEPAQDVADAAGDATADTSATDSSAAVDTPAAEPTQEAVDTPAADPAGTEEAVDDGFNSGSTDELALEEEDVSTQAETAAGQVILKAADGTQTSYSTLKEAVDAAPTGIGKDGAITQILVTGTVEISDTIVIDQQKNISIAAAASGTIIKRAAGFLGDMFKVKDDTTSFQFGTGKDGETVLDLTVSGALEQDDATGSIVSVEGGYFGMSDGVTLTGNRTKAPGSAICNAGGSIGLAGGTITGNLSSGVVNTSTELTGGAIYSLGEIRVSGAVIVKDNKDDGINDNSIVLGGDSAYIAAIGALADTADLQVRRSDAAAGKIIVKVGTDENGTALTTMDNILAHVHYLDTTEYTINSQTGALDSVTSPVSTMVLTADSISWNNAYDHTIDLTFHTNEGGKYYVTWVKKSDSTPGFAAVKSKYKSSGDIVSSASVQLTDVAYDTAIKVVVYAEDSKGLEATAPLVLTLKAKASTPTEAPAATTTPTPTTRATINPSVSESKVTGLEKALEFYPKQMYNFTVTGAGTDNTDPVKGDTKWIPYGWSMSAKNIDTGYQKSWSIGNVNGIKQAKTFKMYIFFQKYIYNGTEWEATGVREALPTEFKSKAIDFTVTPSGTITPTATDGNGGSGGYDYNGSGSGDGTDSSDGDDAENHDGTDSDTGSSSASNARTADNSPIATMMMLASLSLVAGGYVIVRKRKKEN